MNAKSVAAERNFVTRSAVVSAGGYGARGQ